MTTTVRRLIEKASEIYGTDTEIAARLGVTKQRLWEWKTERRPMPLDRVAHLALLAGCKPESVIAALAVERYRLADDCKDCAHRVCERCVRTRKRNIG